MIIYPAIDIKDGKCVRLTQGLIDQEKVYFQSPQQVARLWQKQGAECLHLVDLDGAFTGSTKNLKTIEAIISEVDIPVQVGGGIRNIETIQALLQIGAERVILGTKALEDKAMLVNSIEKYGNRIVVSIDAKDGMVALEGWVKLSNVKAVDFVRELETMGVDHIVYTDISRDGMLEGPNLNGIKTIKEASKIKLIASGGVSCLQDLISLKELDVEGAIVGKALYEERFTLKQARGVIG
ncbi:1-(5-phosphoribosyl)-5-[(5-phosphoribosylamino)methylideneamino]imidazole-4-carboxamide isomerase [Alkaliphilus peptidifermentans]|uniref:1-(5-phosphoribosyl)-5-[(5-phosphoribosylamino)methylideneamino] imidazole-4-carboxamide isomerase n=1 Tax=Alkaliphilus peptidifermentans DSM 18978 TaxID=1120976 RepID=A0A1G5AD22_9FIRM|nr:1-(5-phosphoribosyl)-5-[(5-phosphoribosylamino)methylideneamino]imidazole-4-carboxamide isomerase [Alkaliphilus peptidifermentans]SCX75761.1 1-(5-phosphoribosyl)-5-[(5-phosphoribosylamino)methylideneamino] imidazole-4-carboxamide isomerase [Alkaliphilus peptidifermentans DSM 18978]